MMLCKIAKLLTTTTIMFVVFQAQAQCIDCHKGIEDIRENSSAMMMSIKAMGTQHGDGEGCVICHGGNPTADTAEEAHKGKPSTMTIGPKNFYPDPGSLTIANRTCGMCHPTHHYRLERALMNTEAEKIQGNQE